jgi:ABC-type transporter Mla MlaB component
MTAPCVLPSEITIYTISELYPQCVSWLTTPQEAPENQAFLRVTASAVAEVDAAGVQLLLSLSNTLQAQQRQLQLVSPSQALTAACAALGACTLMSHADLKGAHL